MITKIVNSPIGSHRAINTDHETSEVGMDVVVGKEPEPTNDRIWVLDAIQYSYRAIEGAVALGKPIKGGITVKVGDKVKWDADVPDFTGVLNLYIPGQVDKIFTVLLKGSDGYIGKLNVQWHLEPSFE
jgi:hypothetical protein